MKTLITLLLLALSSPCWGGSHSVSVVVGPAAGGGCSATPAVDTITSYILNSNFLGDVSNDSYVGQHNWTFPQAGQVCKIEVKARYRGTGSITGITYNAQIRALDGDGFTLSTIAGTSDGLSGNDSWNDTVVAFNFSAPVTVDTTTAQNVVITTDTIGAAYISIYGTETSVIASTGRTWRATLANNAAWATDLQMRVYYVE